MCAQESGQGDVLVCITGALTGNVAIVDVELPAAAFVNQHVALVRPLLDAVAPRYIAYQLHSEGGGSSSRSVSTGARSRAWG